MARVRFKQNFDYKPTPMVTIAYKAGREETVRRECADQAIALGRAVEVRQKRRPAAKAVPATEQQPAPAPATDGEE